MAAVLTTARIEALRPKLTSMARDFLRSAADVDDVVQEVVIRMWRSRESYDPTRSTVLYWARIILLNLCYTYNHRRTTTPLALGDWDMEHGSVEWEPHERMADLHARLPSLKPADVALLGARAAGYSYAELVKVFGCSERTLLYRLAAARAELSRE